MWPYSIMAVLMCSVSWLSYHCVAQPWLGVHSIHPQLMSNRLTDARQHLRTQFCLPCGFFISSLGSVDSPLARTNSRLAKDVLMRNWKDSTSAIFLYQLYKVSCDESWKNLTAMNYHYWTQPIPNPLSLYMHRLPQSFHKCESILTHVIEIPGILSPNNI